RSCTTRPTSTRSTRARSRAACSTPSARITHDVELRLADPERRYAAVRLCSALPLAEAERSYRRVDGAWVLRLPAPPVARLEYELELIHADGRREQVCDPQNPHRAPGAFGEKSELRLDGYAPPAWPGAEAVPGRTRRLVAR